MGMMRRIWVGLLLVLSANVWAQQVVPPTTSFTRELLRATTAAEAVAKLGIVGGGGTNALDLTASYAWQGSNSFALIVVSNLHAGVMTLEGLLVATITGSNIVGNIALCTNLPLSGVIGLAQALSWLTNNSGGISLTTGTNIAQTIVGFGTNDLNTAWLTRFATKQTVGGTNVVPTGDLVTVFMDPTGTEGLLQYSDLEGRWLVPGTTGFRIQGAGMTYSLYVEQQTRMMGDAYTAGSNYMAMGALVEGGLISSGPLRANGAYLTNIPQAGVQGLPAALTDPTNTLRLWIDAQIAGLTSSTPTSGISLTTGTNIATTVLAQANKQTRAATLIVPAGDYMTVFASAADEVSPMLIFSDLDGCWVVPENLSWAVAGGFYASAAGLTNGNASTFFSSGTIPLGYLPAGIVTNNFAGTMTFSGPVSIGGVTRTSWPSADGNSTNFWGRLHLTNLPPLLVTAATTTINLSNHCAVYKADITGNVTLTWGNVHASEWRSAQVWYTNGTTTTYGVTLPTGTATPDAALTYYVTNGTRRLVSVGGVVNFVNAVSATFRK